MVKPRCFFLLLALVGAVATACDKMTDPADAVPTEAMELVRFYTENIPRDGMIVFGGDGTRTTLPHGPEARFAQFVTNIPTDRSLILTHNLEFARDVGITGGFWLNDKMLYRAETSSFNEDPFAVPAAHGTAASGSSSCYLTDYHNPPGTLDFIRNSARAQEFTAYARCVGDLAKSIEGEAGCVVVSVPVWNSDTDKWDLESYVVCDPLF